MGSLPRWRVPQDSTFHWRHWDSEFVVYHENSGDTHRLNALGAAVLKHLTTTALTTTALSERLESESSLGADQPSSATIDDLIGRLHDLGLVELVHDPSDPLAPGPR